MYAQSAKFVVDVVVVVVVVVEVVVEVVVDVEVLVVVVVLVVDVVMGTATFIVKARPHRAPSNPPSFAPEGLSLLAPGALRA